MSEKFDLAKWLGDSEKVNRSLDFFLPEDQKPVVLHKAMRYSIFAGGKRVRRLSSWHGEHQEMQSTLPLACAVECIHLPLIHDDLRQWTMTIQTAGRPAIRFSAKELRYWRVTASSPKPLPSPPVGILKRYSHKDALLTCISLGSLQMVGGQAIDLEAKVKRSVCKS